MTSSRMLLKGASSMTPLGLSTLLLLTIETMCKPIPVPEREMEKRLHES